MIQLQKHIEALLLENECVIVPDFGGFMTHSVPARYDQDDFSFIPPTRTLGFNPQLRMNDSLLALSYVDVYDISYPEALRRIEQEVKELKGLLDEEGSYHLENLGTLTVNEEGNYQFSPCEAGIASPELYGLGSYTFMQLKDKSSNALAVKEQKEQVAPQAQEVALDTPLLEIADSTDNAEEESNTITLKVSWIRNAVAVAATIVAFFFISTPVANSDLGTQSMSHLQHQLLYKLIPQDTNMVPAEPATEKAEVAVEDQTSYSGTPAEPATEKAEVAAKPAASEAAAPQKIKSTKTTYYIIVASQVKMSNAESYVAKLKEQGFKDARVWVYRDVVRVVSGEFATQEEAYRQLNKMNTREEFYEAWVYKHTTTV